MSNPALHCPRDKTLLETIKYEGNIEVDRCGECRGMWLDKGELEAIQHSAVHAHNEHLERLPDHIVDNIDVSDPDLSAPICCPKCGAEMEAREYAFCSRIIIDTCVEGCGVWLDPGEIEALEVFFERSQAETEGAIPLRWRLWASLVGMVRK
ncbi:MAG: hypothetical protein RJA70_1588 [Pseudomonadota bacterium]|jgi:Zn-finger nucleic acid-binding protein